ncbi:MAG TPA: FecR family protein [Chloroflexota bacterium]|nr:FecR family protein [Chloroflexota bacterium]
MRLVWRVALLAAALLAPNAGVAAAPLRQASTATLTIITGQAQVQPPGGSGFAPASDGQPVGVGARVRTGPGDRAVLTFFDGTTATLDPDTEISLDRVEPSGNPGGLLTGVGLAAGRVWAQVTSLVERGSSFEVQAGSATAIGREGVTGYRVFPDGTVVCWDIDGAPMPVRTPSGEVELVAGQQITFPPGQTSASPVPREFGPGVLEVQTSGPVLARLVNPDGLTTGFPLDDLVVNQLVDASTSLPGAEPRLVRVHGPLPGRHQLVLKADGSGPYTARVTLWLDNTPLFDRQWAATATPGVTLLADLTITARDGVPSAAEVDEPRPLSDDPPGRFVTP